MTKLQELTTIIVNQLSKLYIKTPFHVKQITYQPGVRKGGGGGGVLPVETQENEWNEAPHVQLFAARSYWTQTSSYENEASFLFRFTQPEGGYHSRSSDEENDYKIAVAFEV